MTDEVDERPDLFDPKTGRPLVTLQWQVHTPDGRTVKVWDLPIRDTTALATDFKTSWSSIVDNPLTGDGSLMVGVYRMCCRFTDQEASEGLSTREIYDKFEPIADDKPTVYEDGLPKEAGETPTD